MDGNCSNNEEEEFVDIHKDDMPEVFKNIAADFEQLDKIDAMAKEIKKTKNTDNMQALEDEVNSATEKVIKSEGLVNRLENEIIEWDALKKLCRRDEELAEIDVQVTEFEQEMEQEQTIMATTKEKQEKILEEEPENEKAAGLLEGVKSYLAELGSLKKHINQLRLDKYECFIEFDGDIPSPVKKARNLRNKSKQATSSTLPTDQYYMIEVNCKYRQRITTILQSLWKVNLKNRELREKYADLKKELNVAYVKPEVKKYKPVKNCEIDQLWAYHLNRAHIDLPVIRTGPGKYTFGSKKITAKITNNGKLLVRYGSGYMSADEFITHHGE